MTPEQILTLIENKGVGFVLIVGLLYLLYAAYRGAKKVVADFYDLFKLAVHNHLTHLQKSMETLVDNSTEANKKLDVQNQILGMHGTKLDDIIEQTRPQSHAPPPT